MKLVTLTPEFYLKYPNVSEQLFKIVSEPNSNRPTYELTPMDRVHSIYVDPVFVVKKPDLSRMGGIGIFD